MVTPNTRSSAALCAEGAGFPWSSFRLHLGAQLQILGKHGLNLIRKRLQQGRRHRDSLPAPCPGWSSALSSSVLHVAIKVLLVSAEPALLATHQPALCLPQPGRYHISPLPVAFLTNGLQTCGMPWPLGIAPALPSDAFADLSAKGT